MVPHVKAVSRPFGRWPKASLYMGMMHGPRSSPGAAADTLPTFIGKKLRIYTGANTCVALAEGYENLGTVGREPGDIDAVASGPGKRRCAAPSVRAGPGGL